MPRKFIYTPEQEAWLTDLETTDAPQTTAKLHTENGFCCLGRACIVFKTPQTSWINEDGIDVFSYEGESGPAPQSIVDKLHLFTNEGKPRIETKNIECLVELNDAGKTFKEIAAIIRAHPWRYFRRDALGTIATNVENN